MKMIKASPCCPRRPRGLRASPKHAEAFKALAHLDRLRVFFQLARAGRPLPAGAVQAALGLPGPTLSHHLDDLERAGLIRRERRERFILSSVERGMVLELVRLLTACC